MNHQLRFLGLKRRLTDLCGNPTCTAAHSGQNTTQKLTLQSSKPQIQAEHIRQLGLKSLLCTVLTDNQLISLVLRMNYPAFGSSACHPHTEDKRVVIPDFMAVVKRG